MARHQHKRRRHARPADREPYCDGGGFYIPEAECRLRADGPYGHCPKCGGLYKLQRDGRHIMGHRVARRIEVAR